jgi:hypothetical protein
MGLKKGNTNNRSGRPKGTPNKVTTDLRKWITCFLEDEREQIVIDWKKLNAVQRIALWERLLRYSLPQLTSTTLTTEIEKLTETQIDQILTNLKKSYDESQTEN